MLSRKGGLGGGGKQQKKKKTGQRQTWFALGKTRK